MKKIALTLIVTICFNALHAQSLIAVEHNGVSTFFTSLDSAVTAAQTGDNVYVPGGNFTLSIPISKGYNLIGVGYNPDSTIATGVTQITSSSSYIHIVTGADNGSISGINFYGGILLFGTSTSDQTVNNYVITRSKMYGLSLGSGATINSSTNISLIENIIDGTIDGFNIKNSYFSKNIIEYLVNFQQGNQFINNTFLYYNANILFAVNGSDFRNNIFLYSSYPFSFSYGSSNNTFYNNLFVANLSGYLPGTDINSIYSVSQSSIFVNQTSSVYDYKQNYHLKSTCPGKNYGTDGTDLGVYGTATPWKEGGVPYNPHIQFQSIATQTDGNGNLSVNIKVAAQKN